MGILNKLNIGSKKQNKEQNKMHSETLVYQLPAENKPTITKTLVVVSNLNRQQDLTNWQNAVNAARGELKQRKALYEVYSNQIDKDDFLASLIDKRINPVLLAPIAFKDKETGEDNTLVAEIIKQKYFQALIKQCILSKVWGYSLCELHWPKPGKDILSGSTTLIPRAHVKPETSQVLKSPYDLTGITYTQPPYRHTTVAFGETDDLGILLQATILSIRGFNNMSDWGEVNEEWGLPSKHVKVNNEQQRKEIEKTMDENGINSTLITDTNVDVKTDYPSISSGSGGSFDTFDTRIMQRMAIRFLGQSMTTLDSGNAGFAQSKIHGAVEEKLGASDRLFVLREFQQITRYLNWLGYNLKGEWYWKDVDTLTLLDQLKIDKSLNTMGLPLSASELRSRYNRKEPDNDNDQIIPKTGGELGFFD